MKIGKTKILVFLLVLLILAIAAVLICPVLYQRDKMDRQELTRLKMRQIAVQILSYHSDSKSWPETGGWEQQVRGYLERETIFPLAELLVDSWGNRIEYKVKTNGSDVVRYLHSFGPNRVDDHGTNDDIVMEISISSK